MFEKLGGDKLADLQTLALRLRYELAAIGLPAVIPGLDPVLASGAEVEVDDGQTRSAGYSWDGLRAPVCGSGLATPSVSRCSMIPHCGIPARSGLPTMRRPCGALSAVEGLQEGAVGIAWDTVWADQDHEVGEGAGYQLP
jgi:hypothetical protein